MQPLDFDVLQDCARKDMTCADIARFLRVSYLRVWQSVRYHGIEVQQGPVPLLRSNAQVLRVDARRAQFEEMVKAGKTRREIMATLHIGYATISKWLRLSGLQIASCAATPERSARIEKMASMYRQGLTLAKIGDEFGITRERVRQLLRRHGLESTEGGAAKSASSKKSATAAVRDARSLARYGLPFEDMKKWRAAGLVRSYRNQKASASARGIAFRLNFAQWLDVWLTSGKLDQRGRGKGRYVMSRIKDAGGYVVGNVHIKLATENSREAIKQWIGKTKENPGVFHLYPGLATPYLAKVGKRSLGLYASEEEAVQARIAFLHDNGRTLDANGRAARKAA